MRDDFHEKNPIEFTIHYEECLSIFFILIHHKNKVTTPVTALLFFTSSFAAFLCFAWPSQRFLVLPICWVANELQFLNAKKTGIFHNKRVDMRHATWRSPQAVHVAWEQPLPLGAHVVSETKVSGIRWRANQLVWNSKLSNVNIMGFTLLTWT